VTALRHALYLPPFGALADPHALVDVAVAAEEAGWDGVYLWDHIIRPPHDPDEIADTWLALAAIAAATERIRLGPMVTPLVRRRPQKVAREIVTLDRLADGRLTVGLGLGVNTGRELEAFDELVDERARGDVLDEATDLLTALLGGDTVIHRGAHFTAEAVRFRPTAVQQPHPPLWFATRSTAGRPLRRAARHDGLFPIEVEPAELTELVDRVGTLRGGLDGFDVAVLAIPGVDLDDLHRRGATWAMHSFLPGEPVADVLDYIQKERPRS
jgi:alkanesulfonate monooxygenase SsuD/methylene tetrahydromethanopterin reductase-like flavin-dependent oxidoreductase (luciferase family)